MDQHSGIWAFGAVLWEMLTGRRLFDGPTVSDILKRDYGGNDAEDASTIVMIPGRRCSATGARGRSSVHHSAQRRFQLRRVESERAGSALVG